MAILHQGFIPTYRVGFFELLNQRSAREYVVFHGDPPSGKGRRAATGPFDFPNVRVRNLEAQVFGRSLVYQPVIRRLARSAYHGIVVSAEIKFVSSLLLFALFKATGRPVLLWGQGFEKEEDVEGASARLYHAGWRVKARWAASADGYLAYTAGGARHLAQAGIPSERIAVLRNTIDMGVQSSLHDRLLGTDERRLRAELKLAADSVVLLFIGRVYREKRLGDLLDAVEAIERRGLTERRIDVVVIGDGPDLEAARARRDGPSRVQFLGELYDTEVVARYLRVAAAVVIPGGVGLAVNHAFAHGVPVITREGEFHGAELEYMTDDVNGLMVEGGLEEFITTLAAFVDSPSQQEALARGALEKRPDLGLEPMVAAFDRAVDRALRRDGAPTST